MKRVLIVDDSLTVRMDLDEVFRGAGWAPTLAASAAEARSALKGGGFDCAVLDVLLPDASGLDLVGEIKGAPATAAMPVILLSTKAEIADQVRSVTVGADDYVGKPYDRAYLVSRAQQLVEPPAVPASATAKATILVIEDSPAFANSLQEALAQAGYRIILARSGEEGLQAAALRRPDAAVVDGVLPGMDGPTVVQRFKTDGALRAIPCLLLTGALGAKEDELRSLESGADAFVRKDEGLAAVLARLRAMLRPAGKSTQSPAAGTSVYGPKTLLVVDDSPTFLDALATQLRRDNYNVVLARSGAEALDLLQARPVDCILLDLLMPEMSGQEVCQRIKASPAWRYIPVIMLTGMETPNSMLAGFNAGADDFVAKSGDLSILRARLRAQLRRRQFEEEARRVLDDLRKKDFEVAQARLVRESEQRMQLALQVSHSFAFEWEPATDRVLRSDSCGPILGLPAAEAGHDTAERFFQRVHREDRERLRQCVNGLKPGADTYQAEYRVVRPDRTIAMLEEYARGFFDSEGRLRRLVGVTTDITDRKRTEAELRVTQEQLVRANQELEQRVEERTAKLQEALEELEHFSYTITHDMRAPLRAMRGFAHLLVHEAADLPDAERNDLLRRISSAAGRMDQLITDALSYSKIVKDEQVLTTVDTGALLKGIVESYPHLQPPAAEIILDGPLPKVMGNEAGLVQCFSNLLSNAVKFVAPGTVPRVRIHAEAKENGTARRNGGFKGEPGAPLGEKPGEARTRSAGRLVRLWFEDNGIGIAREHQDIIWRMFQRLNKSYEGTGIGLALVRKTVERMGGAVGVESEVGRGSRFWLELRRATEIA